MSLTDKKRSFVFYPMSFLAAVHNFKKTQIADFIIALCEINLYGTTKIQIRDSELSKRMKFLQDDIDINNENYLKLKEKRRASGSKGGSRCQANAKQALNKDETSIKQIPDTDQVDAEHNVNDNVYGDDNDDGNANINHKKEEKNKEKRSVDNFTKVRVNGTTCGELQSIGDICSDVLASVKG